jgi:DNA topoisomerase-2
MTPWWDGFRGSVVVSADRKRVQTRGIYEFVDDEACQVRIRELPVGVWTKDYKAFLDEMLVVEPTATAKAKGGAGAATASDTASAPRMLKNFQEAYNDVDVEFLLTLDPDYYFDAKGTPAEFEKRFKLINSQSMTNMVAFDVDGHIRRFGSTGEILETYYVKRIGGYVARKANELARMDAELVELDARVRFVRAVVNGELVVANAEDAVLLAGLRGLGLPPLSLPTVRDGTTEPDNLRAYEYLLRMRVDRLKAKAVAELEEELAATQRVRAALAAKSPEQLWLDDLDLFEAEYVKF